MTTILGIGFTAPWLLLGLLALPLLWILLRAVPPAPIRRRFPGVALLLGLTDDESQTDRTPWWLLLLRTAAIAAAIVGFAGPVLNPQPERSETGPLLIVMEASWADARDWPRRLDRAEALLDEAARAGRPVAVVRLTEPPAGPLAFRPAGDWSAELAGLQPRPWLPSEADVAALAAALEGRFESFWMSSGLAQPWTAPLLEALEAHGPVTVFESPRPVVALSPARFAGGLIELEVRRARADGPAALRLLAHGRDPAGIERVLSATEIELEPGETARTVELSLPAELRNRISRFALDGVRSAGAVALTDDALRRREVALIAGREDREGLELLSPLHYLREALEPTADLVDGDLTDILLANPDVIVLADVATLAPGEALPLAEWVENGGLLLRFAGPRLAASDVSRAVEDPLMPVRLRAGGRTVGGAMSWGEPKALRPFSETSPFFGLPIPDDVRVTAQVMAQPDPDLAERVIATLADGTPLVTRKRMGQGQVVLFHVTANAEWSTLPLSGLFVAMLERLAVSTRPAAPSAEDLAGTVWAPDQVLTAFGVVENAGTRPGVPGEVLAAFTASAETPPGLYAGEDRRLAVNAAPRDLEIAPTAWPARIPVEGLAVDREAPLKGLLLAAALGLLLADVLASLWIGGRLGRTGGGTGGASAAKPAAAAVLALVLVAGLAALAPGPAGAQATTGGEAAPAAPADQPAEPATPAATRPPPDPAAEAFAIAATREVVLAHVVTGDRSVDRLAADGLRGLSRILARRTSIEPAEPIAVDLEAHELAFFPFLYWPITPDQPAPSQAAYAKLNRYLRTGGMILFDTRDADIARFGAASPNGRKLQQLAAPLDIPPLEPVPDDHVLTRTFYLLQDFPGRHASRDVWVEAAPADAVQIEGMPFRNLNDNVTPVVIGGNDWAAAWATDARGTPLYPVGRGFAGERQREIAYRFGVNLIMHVLTGNYKSDQVHVPALLDRLGN